MLMKADTVIVSLPYSWWGQSARCDCKDVSECHGRPGRWSSSLAIINSGNKPANESCPLVSNTISSGNWTTMLKWHGSNKSSSLSVHEGRNRLFFVCLFFLSFCFFLKKIPLLSFQFFLVNTSTWKCTAASIRVMVKDKSHDQSTGVGPSAGRYLNAQRCYSLITLTIQCLAQ